MRIFRKIAVIWLATLSTHGQGTVNFSNIGLQAQIFDFCTGAPAIAGDKYTVGLYWAVNGTTDESLFQLAGATTNIAGPPGTATGLYNGGTRTLDITPPGFFAMIQVRVWETVYGSYDNAYAQGGEWGTSSIVRIDTGDPTTLPPGTPGSLKGISGIFVGLECVPEPSVLAMSLMGLAGGAAFFYRAKRR